MRLRNIFLLALSLCISTFSFAQTETFDYTGSLQYYTVPAGVTFINITSEGAQGGNNGGLGAIMSGDFEVTPGDVLTILVGEQGGTGSITFSGGGGGSFVVNASDTPLVVAGGGGGKAWNGLGSPTFPGIDATTDEDGNNGYSAENELPDENLRHGIGGIDGNGSTLYGEHGTPSGGNGAGLLTNGSDGSCGLGGMAFLNGGAGGTGCGDGVGGYGGGASSGDFGGGGAGGYSGGGGSYSSPSNGGGGGSFNSGTNQENSVGNTGNGSVVITVACDLIDINTSATSICVGDMLTLTAISESGAVASWDNGAPNGTSFVPTSSSTGETITYIATTTNPEDCPAQVDITINPLPEFSLSPSDELLGADGEIILAITSGIPPYTYDWDNDGTGDFDDTQNLTSIAGGTYTVSLKDGNGCITTESATVSSQLSIGNEEAITFDIYPNPTIGITTINFSGPFKYQVIDITGKIVLTGSGQDQAIFNLSSIENGAYFIRLTNQEIMIEKMILKK